MLRYPSLAVAAAVAIVACEAPAGADASLPAEKRSKLHFESGLAHFKLGEYEAAVGEFEEGYRDKPLPLFLYNIAQAARRAGQLEKALDNYRRYIDILPTAHERKEVVERIAELEPLVEKLHADAAARAATPTPTQAPTPTPVPAAAPLTTAPSPAVSAVAVTATSTEERESHPWYKDVAGGTLTLAGLAVLAAGAGVAGHAAGVIGQSSFDYDHYLSARGAGAEQAVGFALLGVGGALLLAGVIRYVVVGARDGR